MDRLLRIAFEKLIRVGNLQVSTANTLSPNTTYAFGLEYENLFRQLDSAQQFNFQFFDALTGG
jgi:hypothetical protein